MNPHGTPEPLVTELDRAGRDLGVTLFHLLVTAVTIAVGRSGGVRRLAIGAPASTRDRTELAGMVGMLLDTVVIPVDVDPASTLQEQARRVRRACFAALGAAAPYHDVVAGWARATGAQAVQPYQVFVSTLETPLGPIDLGDLLVQPREVHNGGRLADLAVMATPDLDGRLRIDLEHDLDLVDREAAEALADHLAGVLEAIAGGRPDDDVGDLGRPPAAVASAPAPAPGDVLGRILAQAEQRPDAVAVSGAGGSLTYATLVRRALGVGTALRRRDIGPEDRVAIDVARGPDLIVALLGVLAAGAAFVPVNRTHPPARRHRALEDVGCRLALVDAGTADEERPCPTMVVSAIDDEPQRPVAVAPAGLAYVMFTSGSTGGPKAVALPRRALDNIVEDMGERLAVAPDDALLALSALTFDISLVELLVPLARGARLVVASDDEATDPRALTRLAEASAATVLQATPTMWKLMLATGWSPGPGLRAVAGGEALPLDLAQRIARRAAVLWNAYGPTETCIWSTFARVAAPVEQVTIGGPARATTAFVVGPDGRIAPAGGRGEIWLAGRGVARGYAGRPSATADRFVPHPGGEAGERAYRTGDLGWVTADGDLVYAGRADDQVKVNGQRVEPGEIEGHLAGHPSVGAAVVTVAAGRSGAELVAHVVPRDGGAIDPRALRSHLAEVVPAAWIPVAFVAVDEIPRTTSGKLDRSRLPAAPDGRGEAVQTGAWSATEQLVADLWRDLLGRAPTSVDDDLFDLGGTSMVLVRLQARLADELGADLPLARLYRAPSLAAMAALVDGGAERRAVVTLQTGTRPRILLVHPGLDPAQDLGPMVGAVGPGPEVAAVGLADVAGVAAAATVDEMAGRVADAVADHLGGAGGGPIVLAGWSFGGVVAQAAVVPLARRGVDVERLVLLDAVRPGAGPATGTGGAGVRRALGRDADPVEADLADHLTRMEDAHVAAPSGIPVTVVGAAETVGQGDRSLGWGAVETSLECVGAPGGHRDLLEGPSVAVAAAALWSPTEVVG